MPESSSNERFHYSPWITSSLLNSLKVYLLTFGKLPKFSLHVYLSPCNIPVMLEPKITSGTVSGMLIYITYTTLLTLCMLKYLLDPSSSRLNSFSLTDSIDVLRMAVALGCGGWLLGFSVATRCFLFRDGPLYVTFTKYLFGLNSALRTTRALTSDIP